MTATWDTLSTYMKHYKVVTICNFSQQLSGFMIALTEIMYSMLNKV